MSSRSFMDAIRSVGFKSALAEGAKDKTSDGMTKDAKHFAQDLHKVTDPGMKHLVQKDSEAKDYEKMFKPSMDKAPTRLADMEPKQDVDKYVEYNEAVVAEAKKAKKKDDDRPSDSSESEDAAGPMTSGHMESKQHGKGCGCKSCKGVDEEYVTEVAMGGSAPAAAQRQVGQSQRFRPAPPPATTKSGPPKYYPQSYATSRSQSNQPNAAQISAGPQSRVSQTPSKIAPSGMSGSFDTTNQSGMGAATKKMHMPLIKKAEPPKAKPPGSETAAAATVATNPANRNIMYTGPGSSTAKTQPPAGRGEVVPKNSPSAKPPGGARPEVVPKNSPSAKPPAAAKPAAPQATKPQAAKPSAPAVKPQAAKPVAPQAAKPQPKPTPIQQQRQRSKFGRDTEAGPNNRPQGGVTITQKATPRAKGARLKETYEIEWNGQTYVMNESAIQAMDAFIEKYGIIDEGTAGEFIKKEMKHPEKLTAKSNKQKIKQSLAIYYSKKRRGENP